MQKIDGFFWKYGIVLDENYNSTTSDENDIYVKSM